MENSLISRAVEKISSAKDLLEKSMSLCGLVSALFSEAGHELVVVGGSAIEFYTEGSYMSGDVDLCRLSGKIVPMRLQQEIMGRLGGVGGPRSWKVCGLFIDLLGRIEKDSKAPYRELQTEFGIVRLVPVEELLVERILIAVYPQPNPEADLCARKLMVRCLSGTLDVDWNEVERLAKDPCYGVKDALYRLRTEVSRELDKK